MAVLGEDGVLRCSWAAKPGVMRDYHDTEWGTPVHGEAAVFERLTLEAFQSGLSWSTILNKRENFRHAFDHFDAEKVAAYDDQKCAELMADAGIVRNRLKIRATIANARALLALDGTSLEEIVLVLRARRPATTADAGTGAGHLNRVQSTGEGSQAARVRVRRTDHRARADGGHRDRRHPSRRLSSTASLSCTSVTGRRNLRVHLRQVSAGQRPRAPATRSGPSRRWPAHRRG